MKTEKELERIAEKRLARELLADAYTAIDQARDKLFQAGAPVEQTKRLRELAEAVDDIAKNLP